MRRLCADMSVEAVVETDSETIHFPMTNAYILKHMSAHARARNCPVVKSRSPEHQQRVTLSATLYENVLRHVMRRYVSLCY